MILATANSTSSHHCRLWALESKQYLMSRPRSCLPSTCTQPQHPQSIGRPRSRALHHPVGKKESDTVGLWINRLRLLHRLNRYPIRYLNTKSHFYIITSLQIGRSVARLRSRIETSAIDNYTTELTHQQPVSPNHPPKCQPPPPAACASKAVCETT